MKSVYILYIISFFVSCDLVDYQAHITGRYYLSYVDTWDHMSLYYKFEDGGMVGVVSHSVFAVGHNDEFIIIKNHPKNESGNPDKKIINYYIVPVHKELTYSPEIGVIGPLTIDAFEAKRNELKITELKFTKIISALE